MAQQLQEADGKVTFDTMVNRCSRRISQHADQAYSAQAPITTGHLNLDLIFPPVRTNDQGWYTTPYLSDYQLAKSWLKHEPRFIGWKIKFSLLCSQSFLYWQSLVHVCIFVATRYGEMNAI